MWVENRFLDNNSQEREEISCRSDEKTSESSLVDWFALAVAHRNPIPKSQTPRCFPGHYSHVSEVMWDLDER